MSVGARPQTPVMHAPGASLGWLSDGDCSSDWQEIRQLVTESYRMLAPAKLSALPD